MRIFNLLVLSLVIWFIGCTTSTTTETKEIEKVPTQTAEKPLKKENIKTEKKEEKKKLEPSGTPVNRAVEVMKESQKDILEALKFAQMALKQDQHLDCINNRRKSFRIMQAFFNKKYFGYDEYNFWFITQEGDKVSVKEEDGIIKDAVIGMFSTFKRLITVQYKGKTKIQTEFYVDESTGDLMVHIYHNNIRVYNKNYKLAGF